MYAHQNVQEEKLKEIITQLGAINKAMSSFQDTLPRPRSPPNYEEVKAEGLNFSYSKNSKSSSTLSLKFIFDEFYILQE